MRAGSNTTTSYFQAHPPSIHPSIPGCPSRNMQSSHGKPKTGQVLPHNSSVPQKTKKQKKDHKHRHINATQSMQFNCTSKATQPWQKNTHAHTYIHTEKADPLYSQMRKAYLFPSCSARSSMAALLWSLSPIIGPPNHLYSHFRATCRHN